MKVDKIIILDFGSQLTQLIARRLREQGFFSEIHAYNYPLEKIKADKPKGIILSGGPSSVYESDSPNRDVKELMDVAPILGICYGMQLVAHQLGGVVERADNREYGLNFVNWKKNLAQVPVHQQVWMSHGDYVKVPPPQFEIAGMSDTNHIAAMQGPGVWAVQFHPEVAHTDFGDQFLKDFAKFCEMKPSWNAPSITQYVKEKIQNQVGPTDHVLCGLSGGVDSTVVAFLLTQVLGHDRVHCIFVDNGLLRKNEFSNVLTQYEKAGLNVTGVDASEPFLTALKGLSDPEQKRKAIGKTFIDVFEKSIPKGAQINWLAQGTLYPDVIESVSPRGGSVTIKSHHNVGGLPEKMRMKLVEPLRELFKDEVRKIGREIGVPEEMLGRHPFPGPGLAIRVIGEVSKDNLQILKEADAVFINALKEAGIYNKIWQAFCVLLPVKTVGVQGDGRTYERVLALRAVTSSDGMTADWYPFEFEFLRRVSNKITNEVRGVNRVVYDVTSKPPGTIEWE